VDVSFRYNQPQWSKQFAQSLPMILFSKIMIPAHFTVTTTTTRPKL
jgi:hypothetical protein